MSSFITPSIKPTALSSIVVVFSLNVKLKRLGQFSKQLSLKTKTFSNKRFESARQPLKASFPIVVVFDKMIVDKDVQFLKAESLISFIVLL